MTRSKSTLKNKGDLPLLLSTSQVSLLNHLVNDPASKLWSLPLWCNREFERAFITLPDANAIDISMERLAVCVGFKIRHPYLDFFAQMREQVLPLLCADEEGVCNIIQEIPLTWLLAAADKATLSLTATLTDDGCFKASRIILIDSLPALKDEDSGARLKP